MCAPKSALQAPIEGDELVTAARTKEAPAAKVSRVNDPEQTKRDIVAVATEEFADKGLSGARIDEIAARTRTSKRMIYYYFGSKEGLYVAVLEEAYRSIRNIERDARRRPSAAGGCAARAGALQLRPAPAEPELRAPRHEREPAYGRFVRSRATDPGAERPGDRHDPAHRRARQGATAFRSDVDPIDLHMSISALCFYNVSNRYTFSTIFKAT